MKRSRLIANVVLPLIALALAVPALAVDKSSDSRPRSIRDIDFSSSSKSGAAPEGVSNCCFGHAPEAGCDDATCEAAVCAQDSFCCDVFWDSICAGEAIDICEVCAGTAANDECADAEALAVGATVSGSTALASVDSTVPLCGDNFGANPTAPGVWYEVTGTGTVLQASTCNQATYDTQLTVLCQDCETPTCVSGNDDGAGCAGFSSVVEWESELNATYRILVHGFSTGAGNFDLTVTDTGTPSVAPVPCFGPAGACCDPSSGGCTQSDVYLCTLAGGSFAEGIPCATPTGGVTSITSNPAVAIPDNDTAGIADTITVPDGFVVYSASVDVGITHTWIGDLRIRLENVATGQVINMWDRRCSSTDNINTTFVDGGETTLCADIAVPGGQVDPTGAGLGPAFWTLNGAPAAGDWRLIVDDNVGLDTGTFDTWTLNLQQGQAVCYAYAAPQEIPTLDAKGIAALAVLLAGAAAFLLWRRRG